MRLEIRDVASSVVYEIGAEGAVIGRERAKTDISLRDESISKRHARIFLDGAEWYLEDLNSSNGTYLDEQKVSAPVRLTAGIAFSLAQRKFEVVYLDAGEGAHDDGVLPPVHPPVHTDETEGQMPSSMDSGGYRADSPAFEPDEEPEAKGIAYFFVAVPKAIARYLVQVPLMAVNPLGVIRKSAEEQPLPPMTRMEVAAYAIPAGFFQAFLGGVAVFIAAAVNGVFAFGGLIAALPTAAISAAIAGVVGFFAHPITEWVVTKLQGESSPRSRTNNFIYGYTFVILSAIPSALAIIVASLPIPFINLLGPLLSLVVTAVGLFFLYTWVKAFRLVKWTQYVVLVLGALAVLFTGQAFAVGLWHTVDGLLSGTPSIAANTGDADIEAAQKAALAAAETPEARAAIEQAMAAAAAARTNIDAANAEVAAAAAAAAAAGEDAVEAQKDAAAAVAAANAEAQAAAAKAAGKDVVPPPPPPPPPPPTAVAEVQRSKTADPPVNVPAPPMPAGGSRRPAGADLEESSLPTDDHPLGVTGFVAFLAKRDAVEKAISDQPSLIKRKDIRDDYEKLWKVTYDIRERYRTKYKRTDRWKRDKVIARYKDAEVYEATSEVVDSLYAKIFAGR